MDGCLVASLANAEAGSAQDSLKVGRLRCEVSAGLGLIVASRHGGRVRLHVYDGTFGALFRQDKKIRPRHRGDQRGRSRMGRSTALVGAQTGSARGRLCRRHGFGDRRGRGPAPTRSCGGFGRSVTLQPLSLEAQTGVALAAGVAELTLRSGI